LLDDRFEVTLDAGTLSGVSVTAAGGSDTVTWQSTDINYRVEVSSDASADQLAHLLETMDQVAEIPPAIRAGASVRCVSEVHAAMSSDVAIDVTALAINVTTPEELRWTNTWGGEEFLLTTLNVRLLPDGAPRGEGRRPTGGCGTYGSFRVPERARAGGSGRPGREPRRGTVGRPPWSQLKFRGWAGVPCRDAGVHGRAFDGGRGPGA
jgi:hypothetical protein